jgi:hypothetical protein
VAVELTGMRVGGALTLTVIFHGRTPAPIRRTGKHDESATIGSDLCLPNWPGSTTADITSLMIAAH